MNEWIRQSLKSDENVIIDTLLSCLIPKIFARKIRNILKKKKIFRKQNNENKTCIVQGKMRDIFFKKEIALVFVQCIMRCIMSKYDHCKIDHWKEKLKKIVIIRYCSIFFFILFKQQRTTTIKNENVWKKCFFANLIERLITMYKSGFFCSIQTFAVVVGSIRYDAYIKRQHNGARLSIVGKNENRFSFWIVDR